VLSQLDDLSAKLDDRDFGYTRLTNQQIAWSLKDILGIHRDYASDLIEDSIGKHGESLQSTLELSGTHLDLYLSALKSAVEETVPDVQSPPIPYHLHGNDWERQHDLNRNDLAHGNRRHHRRYTGPQWLEDEFQIPLPPNHFFRIYVDDNRGAGNFRIRIKLRNEAPLDGGPRQEHAFMVGFDKGFKSPMHAIGNFTLKAIAGTQTFEIFGGLYQLRLPVDTFSTKGIYTIVFKPVEIRTTITDCGVLSAFPDIKGLLFDTSDPSVNFT
jgi:hypothetical protein